MHKIIIYSSTILLFFFSLHIVLAEERDSSKSKKLPIELVAEFPSDIIGTYCDYEGDQYQIIYDFGVLYMSDDFLSLDVSKTKELNGYTVYNIDPEEGYYYFIKFENDRLIEKWQPDEWNYIDFAFLDDSTNEDINTYESCELPKIIEYTYDFIINVAESDMPYNCSIKKPDLFDECTETVFEYLDISSDKELSSAEITQGLKAFVTYLYASEGDEGSLAGALATSTALAPLLSNLIITNYDYDQSGNLSFKEFNHELNKNMLTLYLSSEDLSGVDYQTLISQYQLLLK